MEFFTELEQLLELQEPTQKIERFKEFYQHYKQNAFTFDHTKQAKIFKTPSFEKLCSVVAAKTMPKRNALSTDDGKAYLIHSIAHIEYSAIDLALDHAYRFRDMPEKFYDDWLEVAEDEIRHFLMLEELLKTLGSFYGDFKVHAFLFDVSMKTVTLHQRMAVVPRYLEASGLDSSPKIIEKLERINDDASKKLIESLKVILFEEISHVQKGDYWFKWACEREGIDSSTYFDIVEEILPGAKKTKPFVNIKDRQKAGFSCEELAVISDQRCDS